MKYNINQYFKTEEEIFSFLCTQEFIFYIKKIIKNPDLIKTKEELEQIICLISDYGLYIQKNGDVLEIPDDFSYIVNYEHLYDIWVLDKNVKQKLDRQTLKFALTNSQLILEDLFETLLDSLLLIKKIKFPNE